jgi:hypothetical protein
MSSKLENAFHSLQHIHSNLIYNHQHNQLQQQHHQSNTQSTSSANGSACGHGGIGENENSKFIIEMKSIQPYSTKDEYIYAMKEDLAEWFNLMYMTFISASNFIEQLENGVLICEHANNVMRAAVQTCKFSQQDLNAAGILANSNGPTKSLFSTPGGRSLNWIGEYLLYKPDAKPQSFQARDNISNFIKWCRHIVKVRECLMFETDDLILRKNEKNFILCLLEVARFGSKFGIQVPTIIQLEQEIEAEIARDICEVNTATVVTNAACVVTTSGENEVTDGQALVTQHLVSIKEDELSDVVSDLVVQPKQQEQTMGGLELCVTMTKSVEVAGEQAANINVSGIEELEKDILAEEKHSPTESYLNQNRSEEPNHVERCEEEANLVAGTGMANTKSSQSTNSRTSSLSLDYDHNEDSLDEDDHAQLGNDSYCCNDSLEDDIDAPAQAHLNETPESAENNNECDEDDDERANDACAIRQSLIDSTRSLLVSNNTITSITALNRNCTISGGGDAQVRMHLSGNSVMTNATMASNATTTNTDSSNMGCATNSNNSNAIEITSSSVSSLSSSMSAPIVAVGATSETMVSEEHNESASAESAFDGLLKLDREVESVEETINVNNNLTLAGNSEESQTANKQPQINRIVKNLNSAFFQNIQTLRPTNSLGIANKSAYGSGNSLNQDSLATKTRSRSNSNERSSNNQLKANVADQMTISATSSSSHHDSHNSNSLLQSSVNGHNTSHTNLHKHVCSIANKCTCEKKFPVVKIGEGKYRIGNTKNIVFIRVSTN